MVGKTHKSDAAQLLRDAYKDRYESQLPEAALSGHAADHLCNQMDRSAQALLGKGLDR